MRPPTPLALLLLACMILAGCTDPERRDDEPPENSDRTDTPASFGIKWRPGDYWVQRGYYEDSPDDTTVTLDYFVETIEQINGVEALRIVNSDKTMTHWVRTTDGALMRENIAGTPKDYDPPCSGFAVRLAADQQLEHTCHRIGTRPPGANAQANDTLTTRANGTRNMTVPAGGFDVQQLETMIGDEQLGREFYAARACFPARVVTADGERSLVLDLVTFQCSEGAKP